MNTKVLKGLIAVSVLALAGQAAGDDDEDVKYRPIEDPFGDAAMAPRKDDEIILRSKKGDRAFEVIMPKSDQTNTTFEAPTDQLFGEIREEPDKKKGVDQKYEKLKPTVADREIAGTFPQVKPEESWKQREIERELGLTASEQERPEATESYLAGVDTVKQLFRKGRFEAALIEVDGLIQHYPTNPRLFEMRGTLLDRLGYPDLAIRSWIQALEFNPQNKALERFVERKKRKEKWRGTASQ